MHLLSRLKLIRIFILDMDGVLTDGSLLIDSHNNWLRRMNVHDGYALQLAIKENFGVIVISGSDAPNVAHRLNKLGVNDVFMNVKNKEEYIKDLCNERNIPLNEVLYMGDDIPDYFCMKIAGVGACPANAVFEIKKIASYISPYNGGTGCVRDVIEKVLKLNHKWTLQNEIAST
ncbi:MAG: HAD hydrolase family protein [Ginsengibacter sp.]